MMTGLSALCLLSLMAAGHAKGGSHCRNIPGDPGFPSQAEWDSFNASIDGRVVAVVPSAEICHELPSGSCPLLEWTSSVFRSSIPGAMEIYNWEQDYLSNPPSLCLQNGTTCGQGNVPVYAVNATNASHIQAGVDFAVKHNLKLVVKSSGHDLLGRSTAKGSFLLWTRNIRDVSFTDNFVVNGTDLGSAMTIGSGMPLNLLYEAAKKAGKFYVGGSIATVALAGGYVQGAGHSAFSPAFGLGADNVLEFQAVLANGSLVTANAAENPDLFWALRGGGAGSWGVVTSATVRTYPIFNATYHTVEIIAATNESTAELMTLHAQHIFDWEDAQAGQYFTLVNSFVDTSIGGNLITLETYFPNKTSGEAMAIMKPLLDDARNMNFSVKAEETTEATANDLLFMNDTSLGDNIIFGSRLIPEEIYKTNPETIGRGLAKLMEMGVPTIEGTALAGGKVAENANIYSAVTPKWRTSKTHIIIANVWLDNLSTQEIEEIKETMTNDWVPVLVEMTGESDSGAYSNEADVREPHFQQTFFSTNYPHLLDIKRAYDPEDRFIVPVGVGSEFWDEAGICRL